MSTASRTLGAHRREVLGVDDDGRLRREHAQCRGAQRVGPHPLERVGRHRRERLLGADLPGQAAVGAPDRQLQRRRGVLERLALEQPCEQEVALLEAEQLVVELDVVEAGQETAGLELHQRRRDQEELGRDLEVEGCRGVGLEPVELAEVGVDDRRERHLPELHLLAQDEVEQEVERALVDGGAHLVGHRGERTGAPPATRHPPPRPRTGVSTARYSSPLTPVRGGMPRAGPRTPVRSPRTLRATQESDVTRVLSGIKPTGEIHLGNYLGAVRHWVAAQDDGGRSPTTPSTASSISTR